MNSNAGLVGSLYKLVNYAPRCRFCLMWMLAQFTLAVYIIFCESPTTSVKNWFSISVKCDRSVPDRSESQKFSTDKTKIKRARTAILLTQIHRFHYYQTLTIALINWKQFFISEIFLSKTTESRKTNLILITTMPNRVSTISASDLNL